MRDSNADRSRRGRRLRDRLLDRRRALAGDFLDSDRADDLLPRRATWGALQLFVVDKTIRPALVGGPIELPFLPTIFGLVGKVKTMGIVGLFVGRVLMAPLVEIWREWVREVAHRARDRERKSGFRRGA